MSYQRSKRVSIIDTFLTAIFRFLSYTQLYTISTVLNIENAILLLNLFCKTLPQQDICAEGQS